MNTSWITPARVWALLCALTLLAVALVERGGLPQVSAVAVVLIAAVKSRLVILHYMEVRHASPHWGRLYELWNFTIAALFIIGYFYGDLSH